MLGLGLDAPTLVAYLIVLSIAFTVHEFAHAWTANLFGDDTPRLNGRLTLNPLAHLDPIGTLMLFIAGIGWAKPVPVNGYALERRSPSAMMWVALAGPLSNFIMAALAAIPFRAGLIYYDIFQGNFTSDVLSPFVVEIIFIFLFTNLGLMLFNLIPIFPLDGEKILDSVLPPSWARVWQNIRPYGPLILMATFVLGRFANIYILGEVLDPPRNAIFRLLIG